MLILSLRRMFKDLELQELGEAFMLYEFVMPEYRTG